MIVSCITTSYKDGELQYVSLYSKGQTVKIDMEDIDYLTHILATELAEWRSSNA